MPPTRQAIGRSTHQARKKRRVRASESDEQKELRLENLPVHAAERLSESSEQREMRQPFSLMTHEVVEATCQCLLAQVEEDNHPTEHVERIILEEFGRCLVEIINCATRTTVNNP